jgi:O-antigen ligase
MNDAFGQHLLDMRVRSMHALAALLFAIPLISTLRLAWPVAPIAAGILAVSISRPENGLLIIAGLLPISRPVGQFFGLDGSEAAEWLLLPCLSGLSFKYALGARTTSSPLRLACAAGAAVVVAATVVGARAEPYGAAVVAERYFRHATTGYLTESASFSVLHHGMVWMEGLFLAYLVDVTLRQRPEAVDRMFRMLLASVFGASLFNVNRLADVLVQNQLSFRSALDGLSASRIAIHTPDVNAEGSLYALFAVPAMWSAIALRRYWLWAACCSICVALWWTGSRTAVAGACCGVLATAVLSRTVRRRTVLLGVGLSVLVVVLSIRWQSSGSLSLADALTIRLDMGKAGLLIAASHPAFGVGPGQFPAASRPLVSERVLALFPIASGGENAHNNFIQIIAEFGIVGACALLGFLALPLLPSSRAIGMPGTHRELAGFVGGLYAFLLTCLLGHPFLLPLCLWLFFLTLGVVSGLVPHAATGRRWGQATACFVLVVMASIPWRIANATSLPNLEPIAVMEPGTDPGTIAGVAYITIEHHYAMSVDAAAQAVTVPLRLAPDSAPSCMVRVSMNRRPADVVSPPGNAWLYARYIVPRSATGTSGRLDLLIRQPHCRLRVGQMVAE